MALEQRKNGNGNDDNNINNNVVHHHHTGEEVGPYTRSLEEELTSNPLMYYGDPTANVVDQDAHHVHHGVVPSSHFQHLQHNIEAEAASILTAKQQQSSLEDIHHHNHHHHAAASTNNTEQRRRQYNQRKNCCHPSCTKPAQSKGLW